MRVLTLDQIRPAIDEDAVIDAMRDALIAQSRGECDTPMPMHLDIADPTTNGEVHIKSSYRRGGKYFALKMASTFHGKGNGMILLCDAATGKPLVYLDDTGHLTDVRTAAVAAMTARELRRTDRSIGILGTGIQARLTAFYHQHVLPLQQIFLWGRNPDRAQACAADIRAGFSRVFPRIKVDVLDSPAAVAQATRLIVTCTAARAAAARRERPPTRHTHFGGRLRFSWQAGTQPGDPARRRSRARRFPPPVREARRIATRARASRARNRNRKVL
jgi:ornithine cyclodeaminase